MRLNKLPFHIYKIINEYGLIKPQDSLIVGVSGGPDSVALLKILSAINLRKNLRLRLLVAHFNHQLRGGSSEEDEQFVRNLSKDLSLPFFLKRTDIKKISDQIKNSIEETARRERYEFFDELSQAQHAVSVVVGHNADDNVETLLHRIIRGTGLRGLGGIPIKRPLTENSPVQLIRPLIFTWKWEIISYLEKEQANYRTDVSNYNVQYFRNKIRLELIPFLESQFNPKIKNTLMRLSQIMNFNNEYVSLEAERILTNITLNGTKDFFSINACLLTGQPEIVQQAVIQKILNTMNVPLKKITYEHYTKILGEIMKSGKMRYLRLPGNLYIQGEHGILYFKKEALSKPGLFISDVPVQIPGITPFPPFGEIVSEILDAKEFSLNTYKKTRTKYEEIFDLQSISMPLTVRLKKKGDTISLLGMRGHKKLKDLFIDKKIPIKERYHIPIVTMNGHPIWIIGIGIDNKVKVNPGTEKVVKLTFRKSL